MARVTVEDCVDKIPNRFQLVMMAAQRARDISAGAPITIERDDDKNPVVSLREIAEMSVSMEELSEELIKSLQTFVAMDEPEDEEMDLLAIQQDFRVDVKASLGSNNGDKFTGDDGDDDPEQMYTAEL